MKALLPVYSRLMGYAILLICIFSPFIMVMYGLITDDNLLLCKEVIKMLMIAGLLMILLANRKNETAGTEHIRIKAMRQAFLFTIGYIFFNMIINVYKGETQLLDTSSFLIFMVVNVICLEFGVKKAAVDKMFKDRHKH